ncbi:MAG: FixH family protein [Aggregatilineales bacterium]
MYCYALGRRGLTAVVLIALIVSGCRQQQTPTTSAENPAISIVVTVEPSPPITGEAKLIITLADSAGAPVSGAQVSARGDMTHPGMVPVLAEADCDDTGRCEVPFEWTMGGDWIVDITVTLPDGTTAAQRFDYRVGS